MVAELYDSGQLHKELGIDFEPISDEYHSVRFDPATKPPSLLARLGGESERQSSQNGHQLSKQRRSRSPLSRGFADNRSDVSAWNAADEGARFVGETSDSGNEDGRYGVESARKRRRKEPASGDIIWISDDSEGDQAPKKGLSISGASKRAKNDRVNNGGTTGSTEPDRVDRRREYWRSKGSTAGTDNAD
jgi:hypothetical protein